LLRYTALATYQAKRYEGMRALVTGASSGMGYEMAKILDTMGIEVIITGRREDRLHALADELSHCGKIIIADISDRGEVERLFAEAGDVDIVINNAGLGIHGAFHETTLAEELSVLDINITALHMLTKFSYQHFKEKGSGYLMNVASSAAFFAGPYFASYYASKAYVLRLTQALWKEARSEKIDIGISVFCPGPVDTEFNKRARVNAPLEGMRAEAAARKAIRGMFQRKCVITPGIGATVSYWGSKILPDRLALDMVARIQRKKAGK